MWRVINQFKATVTHSSHCNQKLVYRSIVFLAIFPAGTGLTVALVISHCDSCENVPNAGHSQNIFTESQCVHTVRLCILSATVEMSLVLLFKSSELLIQCGFIWEEAMQSVSGKVEFNACKVSLL